MGVGGRSLVRVPRQVDPVDDGLGTALGIAGGLGGGEEPLSIVEFRHLHSWPTSLALNRPAGVRTRIWAMGCPIHGRLGSDWGYKFIVISSLLKPISWRTDLFAQSSTFFSPHNPGRSAARGRRAHGGAPAHVKATGEVVVSEVGGQHLRVVPDRLLPVRAPAHALRLARCRRLQ